MDRRPPGAGGPRDRPRWPAGPARSPWPEFDAEFAELPDEPERTWPHRPAPTAERDRTRPRSPMANAGPTSAGLTAEPDRAVPRRPASTGEGGSETDQSERTWPDLLATTVEPAGSAVFLDPSGRRRHLVRATAIVVSCATVGAVVLLAAALLGAPVGPSALFTGPDPTSRIGAPSSIPSRTPHPTTTTTTVAPVPSRRPARIVVTTTAGVPTLTSTHAPLPTTPTPTPANTDAHTRTSHTPPGRPTALPTPPGHAR